MCLFTSARTVAIAFVRSAGSEAMYCAGVLTFDAGFTDSLNSSLPNSEPVTSDIRRYRTLFVEMFYKEENGHSCDVMKRTAEILWSGRTDLTAAPKCRRPLAGLDPVLVAQRMKKKNGRP